MPLQFESAAHLRSHFPNSLPRPPSTRSPTGPLLPALDYKEVVVAVARAQGAANPMHAARLFSEGTREEGRDALARNTELLDKASAIAGTGALQEGRRAQKDLEAAPAGAELSHQVKKAKRAALIGFGSNGSVY